MISICVTVKNRSRLHVENRELQLFPNCVRSIVDAVGDEFIAELIVSDWQSTDWPLQEWLVSTAHPLAVTISTRNGFFSRGAGRNIAAAAATGETLFFIDADSLLCRELFIRGPEVLKRGRAYFPILFGFSDPNHRFGTWLEHGFGHCMISRKQFEQTGGWPEYESWGREDVHFYESVQSACGVERERVEGFYHQWHPNDLVWKNRHSRHYDAIRDDAFREFLNMSRFALQELTDTVPANTSCILVDEARLDHESIHSFSAIPFPQHDGEYAGPPEDDSVAIDELERLRIEGASYIAFTWISFWWLEHYSAFHSYLRSRYDVARSTERIVVFDLRSAAGTGVREHMRS
jgi:glycosyltransferase involved in cell wall biosynthesis